MNTNTDAKQIVIKKFRENLNDLGPLPPDHELYRWIEATNVSISVIFCFTLYNLIIYRRISLYQRPCTGRVTAGGNTTKWTS